MRFTDHRRARGALDGIFDLGLDRVAVLAVDDNYVRPEVDGSLGFAVEGAGRATQIRRRLDQSDAQHLAEAR